MFWIEFQGNRIKSTMAMLCNDNVGFAGWLETESGNFFFRMGIFPCIKPIYPGPAPGSDQAKLAGSPIGTGLLMMRMLRHGLVL